MLIRKKYGDLWLYEDNQWQNTITKKDWFQLPRTDYNLDMVTMAKWFSTLDLKGKLLANFPATQ
jgi:hypothetical protein